MRVVIKDPEDKAGIGRAGGEWARRYHSSQRILDLQLAAFEPAVTQALSFDKDGKFTGLRPNIRGLNR